MTTFLLAFAITIAVLIVIGVLITAVKNWLAK